MTILHILVAARWVHFAALFALFGCPLSCLLVRAVDPADAAPVFRATDRLLRVAAVFAAISGLVWIAALIANMAGSFADAATLDTLDVFFFATQFGPVVIVRLILLAAGVLVIALPRRVRFGGWLLVSAALLLDQAWLGHAANGGASLLGAAMIGAYAIHVLAGAAWVGGLPILLFTLFARRRDPGAATREIVTLLSRYSALATAAVTLIVLSGTANALFRVHGHPSRLVGTSYGDVLLAKLLLVAVMLMFAYYNRFIALPRLRTARQPANLSGLAASIGTELALGALVVGAAALLGVTPPPD